MNTQSETTLNALQELTEYGQSVWLDYIRRHLITSGDLQRLIDEDGLRGITSNPSIFEKAIAGSTDYADILSQLHAQNLAAKDIYERIAIRDVQDAAGLLRPVYDRTARRDGYVSLEVSPQLARDTSGTIEEARRLWKAVNRPNVMIKVPGTAEGVPAIEQLIGEGVNVNITLLFSQDAYVAVAEAFLRGLEKAKDVSGIASVASFFVSRIDTLVDELLAAKSKDASDQQRYAPLLGKVAIANAKQAYAKYKLLFGSERWKKLEARGAKTQRLLWASTSTKNPKYRDVMYVEELIGPDTVNTLPLATLQAFREHGRLARTLDAGVEEADRVMRDLEKAGISMRAVTDRLLDDGIKLFAEAFDKLLGAIGQKKSDPEKAKPKISAMQWSVPEQLRQKVQAALDDWTTNKKSARLWKRDASLWTNSDEAKWLGWLNIADDGVARSQALKELAAQTASFDNALLLGMGGSSLCPEVLAMTFGRQKGHPQLHVLDSTDPAQVKSRAHQANPANSVFIVSSKSGTTLEPNIFKQYFLDEARKTVGAKAGEHFLAITDPGSKLQAIAEEDRFRRVFPGEPSIGGRYSALSNFGLVPAAVMGLDVSKLLDRTEQMVHACGPAVAGDQNPGVVLGCILGVLGNSGRDKVTIISSPRIYDLGAWLEQLLAESTGKQGKGLIPVNREELAAPDVYGDDRVFAYLRLQSDPSPEQDRRVAALEKAGQPVVRIEITDIYDMGQEFFRWEFATAVAGSVLGIHPFNQPDVEASKVATRQLTAEYERTGSLPAEKPIADNGGIKLFADERNARELWNAGRSVEEMLAAHLERIKPGDYFALLAYVEMNDEHERFLQSMRHQVRDSRRVATCVGFGPRFLHSTGQAYKGGPNSGVFLQITADDAEDLPVPGQKYTFGIVKAAQARGDFQVLAERGRRALRVHLSADVSAGLRSLAAMIEKALGR